MHILNVASYAVAMDTHSHTTPRMTRPGLSPTKPTQSSRAGRALDPPAQPSSVRFSSNGKVPLHQAVVPGLDPYDDQFYDHETLFLFDILPSAAKHASTLQTPSEQPTPAVTPPAASHASALQKPSDQPAPTVTPLVSKHVPTYQTIREHRELPVVSPKNLVDMTRLISDARQLGILRTTRCLTCTAIPCLRTNLTDNCDRCKAGNRVCRNTWDNWVPDTTDNRSLIADALAHGIVAQVAKCNQCRQKKVTRYFVAASGDCGKCVEFGRTCTRKGDNWGP